jgi:uncharacterized ParB-like nuclease family protein
MSSHCKGVDFTCMKEETGNEESTKASANENVSASLSTSKSSDLKPSTTSYTVRSSAANSRSIDFRDWTPSGAMTVVKQDKTYYVLDGHHRLAAIQNTNRILQSNVEMTVPAMCYVLPSSATDLDTAPAPSPQPR